jgi:hypothetical protein
MARWNLTTILRLPFLLFLFFGDVVLPSSTPEESCRTVLIDDQGVAVPIVTDAIHGMMRNACDANTTTKDDDNRTAIQNATMPSLLLPEEEEDVIPSPNSVLFTSEEVDPDFALGSDMGVVQSLDADSAADIYQRIREARVYLHEVVQTEAQYHKVRGTCRNAHSDCTYWAVLGECDNNPGPYMCVRNRMPTLNSIFQPNPLYSPFSLAYFWQDT